MTEREVSDRLQRVIGEMVKKVNENPEYAEIIENLDVAVNALEARDAKKVIVNLDDFDRKYYCPVCKKVVSNRLVYVAYCGNCGQKLRWK